MKRKNVQLPAPAYLCSSALGQQVVYHKRSIHEIHEGPIGETTDVLSSPRIQAALHSAQNTLDDALLSAVQNKRIPQMIARLIAQGANIDTMRDGLSPLIIAIINRDVAIATFLLTHGANPVLRDEYGNTPLHVVATHLTAKTLKIAEILLIAGAHVDAQNDLGQTPLHLHGKAGALYIQFAHLLIKNHARLDLVDIKGNEPFTRLPEKKRTELLRFALFALFDRN
ncbi:MAG: B-cell CLL/lymphoma 3 protein [Candidatus Dependentiae bacterium]|nr:B-cell CLL/lymphoma 3 protein [Candidatus Dependentiae bacterium]